MTPGTSLLVLETLQQYVEHKVEPPASRKQMRADYLRLVEERSRSRAKAEGDKLDQVAALWANRVRWWETDHAKEAAKRKAVATSGGAAGSATVAQRPRDRGQRGRRRAERAR